MKFSEYDKNTWTVKKAKPKKVKDLNPKTNRMKTFKRTAYITTTVPPEKRNFNNIPKYSDGRNRVDFKDWLGIKKEKEGYFGKAANGKWYGWSHRAISGFKVGDTVKATDDIVNNTGKDFKIKNDDQARDLAMKFAKEVS